MKVTVLGSGTSSGIPTIGCSCVVCMSTNPHNKRLRSSIFVEKGNTRFVVDCGPDFRYQALTYGINDIDTVLLTHAHADHTAGIDDLRAYYMIKHHPINLYGDADTIENIRERFAYCFIPPPAHTTVPQLNLHEVIQGNSFTIGTDDKVAIMPIKIRHNSQYILGYRIGNFAYLSDVSEIPEESLMLLKDLDVLITTALRFQKHPSHMSIDEAIGISTVINAKKTWFIHMNHDIEHETVCKALPANMSLCYDGLTFDVND